MDSYEGEIPELSFFVTCRSDSSQSAPIFGRSTSEGNNKEDIAVFPAKFIFMIKILTQLLQRQFIQNSILDLSAPKFLYIQYTPIKSSLNYL